MDDSDVTSRSLKIHVFKKAPPKDTWNDPSNVPTYLITGIADRNLATHLAVHYSKDHEFIAIESPEGDTTFIPGSAYNDPHFEALYITARQRLADMFLDNTKHILSLRLDDARLLTLLQDRDTTTKKPYIVYIWGPIVTDRVLCNTLDDALVYIDKQTFQHSSPPF
jgi:hypothetical protein